MSFYGKMRNTASGLLRKLGARCAFTRTTKGAYVPHTGQYGPDTVEEWSLFAVLTNIKAEHIAGYTSLGTSQGGTRIEVGDMQILVECDQKQPVPKIGDSITTSTGEKWKIVSDMPIAPAGTVVLYKGIVRRG